MYTDETQEHDLPKNTNLLSANLAVWSLVVILFFTTGCMASVLGIKDYDSGPQGTHINFITGADFNFGLNGVDTVDHDRGIKPSPSRLVPARDEKRY
jgi:hypothetical protein